MVGAFELRASQLYGKPTPPADPSPCPLWWAFKESFLERPHHNHTLPHSPRPLPPDHMAFQQSVCMFTAWLETSASCTVLNISIYVLATFDMHEVLKKKLESIYLFITNLRKNVLFIVDVVRNKWRVFKNIVKPQFYLMFNAEVCTVERPLLGARYLNGWLLFCPFSFLFQVECLIFLPFCLVYGSIKMS